MNPPPDAWQRQAIDYPDLARRIKVWAIDLGFQQAGIAEARQPLASARLDRWLAIGRHGTMDYMARQRDLRVEPGRLLPGALRAISLRMDYLPPASPMAQGLTDPEQGYISRYALGRDYHKLMRKRLQRLADRIGEHSGPHGFRVCVDSAPVLEKPLAERAGLGWIGKHSNLINRSAGSWFFLGEILTDLPLPPDRAATAHCGNCRACLDVCPSGAIVAPHEVDARLCISYLTIELHGAIPLPLRPLIGSRIYGCDDCQLVCPWNRFARLTAETDFHPRLGLDSRQLLDLFDWDEATFLRRFEGSPIRRIGYACWQRNLAVALGNAPRSAKVVAALSQTRQAADDMVREHIDWALSQHRGAT